MKKWLLALALFLLPTAASAQCSGVAPANSLCGNLTASPNVPGFYSASGALTGTVDPHYLPVATATNVLGDGVYLVPVTGLTLLGSPSGAGNCVTTACNLPTACLFMRQVATFLGSASIQLAAGTYNTADSSSNQCSVSGDTGGSSTLLVSINGDPITPTNVVIAIQSGQNGFSIQDLGLAGINNLEITNVNGGGPGIICRQVAICDYNNIVWGSWGNSGSDFAATGQGVSANPANEIIAAGTTHVVHWNLSSGARVAPNGTTTLGAGAAWTTFAIAIDARLDLSGWTLVGTGTGAQFSGAGPGYLVTPGNAACASVFPGSGGCSLSNGFLTSAGDLQSDGKLLNSAMPATVRAGDIDYNNGSGWHQSLAGNNSGTQCFTENSSGTPAWATCPTTYTATTWTPAVTTDATPGTPAYTTQLGTYEQIGRQITVRFNITLSGWTGSPTGNVNISGLPVADAGNYGTCVVSFYTVAGLAASTLGITGLIGDTLSTIVLYQNQGTVSAKITAAQIGTTATLIGFCNYHT